MASGRSRSMKVKEVRAVYTGGNIWLFFGRLEDGHHFMVNDDGCAVIADEGIEEATEYAWSEWLAWCAEHNAREPEGAERLQLCMDMLDRLQQYEYGSENNGGIRPDEIKAYREYFRKA